MAYIIHFIRFFLIPEHRDSMKEGTHNSFRLDTMALRNYLTSHLDLFT
jgi:hypothetical protein